MKNFFIIITAALIAVGCASPPKRQPPNIDVDLPAEWTVDDSIAVPVGADTTSWWTRFGSAQLNDLVDEALSENHDIAVAVARVDAAAAIARIAGADLYPNVNAKFDASRRQQNIIGIPIPGAPGVIQSRSTSFGVSLDAMWEIDLWGRIRSGQSAALADVEASWADLAAIRLSIAAQSVKAWFAVIESRLQMELARQTVASYRLSTEQVRRRYEEGVRSSLDLRLALTSLYGAEALLESRTQQFDRAKRQLEILLGRYPAGSVNATGDLPVIADDVPSGLPSELLIRRPDLLAAERRYAGAERRVSQSRRAFFPRLSLTGSTGTLSEDLKDLVDGDFSVWSIAANLTQPIFQGGRLLGNLARSQALSDQVLAQYALAVLSAFGEVESSLFTEETLAKHESHTQRAAEQSEAAIQLAERQYNAGLVDYITVLETQRRALDSQSQLLSVRRQRLDVRVNLHVALGGGFDLSKEWKQFLEKQTPSGTEASVE